MTRRALSVLAFCLMLACPPHPRGRADEMELVALGPGKLTAHTLEDTERSIRSYKRDASGKPAYLARFSDGPRNVPRPRGAAKRLADALQLGTLESARGFLRSRPDAGALAAVKSDTPRTLLWPVVGGRWGRGFGYTRRVRPELRHNGIDIGAKEGAVVRAAADGLVVYSDNGLLGYGNCVMVLHQNGWLTLYAHNLRNTVQAGWRVKRGERIALLGRTGYAWGPHLHFELRDNGRLRDPKPLFTGYKSDEINGPLVELESDDPLPSDLLAAHESHETHEAHDAHDAHDAGETHDAHDSHEAREPNPEHHVAHAKQAAAPAPPSSPKVTDEADVTVALPDARRLLRSAATDAERALAGERVFRNLLWPVKGGALARGQGPKHPGLLIDAPHEAGIRAAADGIVLHAGQGLAGYGDAVVVLHGNGWVTLYDGAGEIAVKAGDRVLRGQWLARTPSAADASAHETTQLRFEWRDGGVRKDPTPLLVGAPQER